MLGMDVKSGVVKELEKIVGEYGEEMGIYDIAEITQKPI
jgi:hypothetical protein